MDYIEFFKQLGCSESLTKQLEGKTIEGFQLSASKEIVSSNNMPLYNDLTVEIKGEPNISERIMNEQAR